MSKKNWFLVFGISLMLGAWCLVLLVNGCAQTADSSGTKVALKLPSGTTVGDPITTPECTVSGAVSSVTGSKLVVNMSSVIPTGSSEAIPISLSKMSVYVGKGDLSASGIGSKAAADWTLVSVGTYTTSATPIDILFILDNTGSMGGEITAVKDSIVAFAQTLEAAGIDAKFGLVTYGDSALHPTPAGYITSESFSDADHERPILDLTTATALKNKLASVEADQGSDLPENPMDAMKWAQQTNASTGAFTNITWRTGAQKNFVIITDSNGHQTSEVKSIVGGVTKEDTASDNKCTTTTTLELNRLRNFNVRAFAVSPNYATLQLPYIDVRRFADGFGESRITAEAALISTGGSWKRMPDDGNVDLTTMGISSALVSGTRFKIEDYSFANGTVYTIIIYYDSDGDGTADGYTYIVFTYTAASAIPVVIESKDVPFDDFRNSNN